jgi:hypothetical protein
MSSARSICSAEGRLGFISDDGNVSNSPFKYAERSCHWVTSSGASGKDDFAGKPVRGGAGNDNRDVVYDGGKVKVVIWYKKHNHPFKQVPVKHKVGQGCDICAEEAREAHRRSSGHTTQSFIERARELHGDRYDYSEVEYTGYDCTIMIKCPEHGLQPVIAYQHIAQGRRRGCKICSSNRKVPDRRKV